jgi:ferrochelatase
MASMSNSGSTTGILLAQLGTPDAPTAAALRRYLREFLSDRRVIDLPRWLWLPILYGPILAFRPRRSAALYRRVWTPQGSPLLLNTRRQADLLQERLGPQLQVEMGMRYGEPSLALALERLIERGAQRVLVAPMFPQSSATTVASVIDGVEVALGRLRRTGSATERAVRASSARRVPELRALPAFCADPLYIGALAARAREVVATHGRPDRWVFSFHGIPQRYARKGDMYPLQCAATARALAAALGLRADRWHLCYQSRFGPEPWLRPYTDEVLMELGRMGVGTVYAVCPGFVADCLETIDEIGEISARRFQEAGGGRLRLVPCLNDHPAWIEALAGLVRHELAAWEQQPATG